MATVKLHLERSQACAEQHDLMEESRSVEAVGPTVQLTYQYLRDGEGEFVATYADGHWTWEDDGTVWSDIVIEVAGV